VLSSLAPARRRLLLGVLALLVAGVVAVVAVLLVRRDGDRALAGADAPPAPQEKPGPVLLVPGYGGAEESLRALASRLRAAGRDATVVPLPGDGTGDLRVQSRVLGAAARAAVLRTGAASVDVVGYSAGGVVARLWVRDGGGRSLARRVVTLGSPHHGTELAALAGSFAPDRCPQACQQLAPGSDLLRRLNTGDETPEGPRWVSVWSTVDEVISPPESSRLEGALDVRVQGVCAGSRVEHGQLPTDPTVQGIVLASLGAAAPAALSTSDCARLSS